MGLGMRAGPGFFKSGCGNGLLPLFSQSLPVKSMPGDTAGQAGHNWRLRGFTELIHGASGY